MLALTGVLLIILYLYLGIKRPVVAMITLPFVTVTFLFLGLAEENAWPVVISVLLFFSTITVMVITEYEPGLPKWPHAIAKVIFIGSISILLIAILLLLSAPFGYFAILYLFLLAAIIRFTLVSRDATTTYVLSTIGSSMRQNLPLSMALESAASGRTDKHSIILRRIQKWLVQGYPLSESIKRGYPQCPGYAVALIGAAEKIDQLPNAINAIEADLATKGSESRRVRPVHPIYPIILMTFVLLVLLGLMIFVFPQFRTVLWEITGGGRLPYATEILFDIVAFVAFDWVLGLFVGIIVLLIIPTYIYVKFRPRRPDEPYLVSRMGDFIKWHLPILHYYEKNYSMVQVIEMLRMSLNAGCTVNDAIANTIGLDVNNCFRKRLRKWLKRVERGDNIAAAARKSKTGSAIAWAFDDKVNQDNTPAVLETLEAFYRTNYSYYVNLARFIMWPCIILLMGVVVGFVIFAIFSPGVEIINTLSGHTIP
jgi:type II secretory pathway component PulF